jgi:hypothetical protein
VWVTLGRAAQPFFPMPPRKTAKPQPAKTAGGLIVPAAGGKIVAATAAEIPSVITGGLIRLDPHQQAAFWSTLRTLFLLWRRQAGKSYSLGAWSFYRMGTIPGHLVVLCSASIALGKEWIYKEAQVWRAFTQAYRELIAAQGGEPGKLVTGADDDKGQLLDVDAIADLFEHQRLETRLYHSRTIYSRSVVVAPNPDTAVGWTGDVGMDEVGRIECLKELIEAIGPILTRNPKFMMRMATTISPDDAHFSREIHGARPEQEEFPVNAAGNFYESKTGYMVHRFDAYDGMAAGLTLYDDKTGAAMTPEEHRASAIDKAAWDRNYGIKETTGGTAAIPAGVLSRCMAQGRGECFGVDLTDKCSIDEIPNLLPIGWQDVLDPIAPRLGLGYDIATTTKKKSNPSSITLMQEKGLADIARLIVRFKTADPSFARALIDYLLRSLPHGLKVRGLSVDASNERFYAIETQRYFRGRLPVHLIVSGETLQHRGETITYKSLLGNNLIATASDGYLALPACDWLEKDWKLVKLDQGRFYAEVDAGGNHADTFDSTKLAKWELTRGGGPARASAAATGSLGTAQPTRSGIRNPYARDRRQPTSTLHV